MNLIIFLVCRGFKLSPVAWHRFRHTLKQARSDLHFLRKLQLHIKNVNTVYCNIIFSWKLVSITLCILTGWAAIAHFADNPIFGILYYAVWVDIFFFYCVVYDKAFQIPNQLEQAMQAISVRIGTHVERNKARLALERQLKSIPFAGIKVGDFHTLERTSTPIFMDYVVKNIVNMLIAYS